MLLLQLLVYTNFSMCYYHYRMLSFASIYNVFEVAKSASLLSSSCLLPRVHDYDAIHVSCACIKICLYIIFAVSPDDFAANTYTVSFAAGDTFPLMGCISGIPTVDDDALEGDHEFSVSIDSVTPNDAVSFDSTATHVVTIIDNDGMLDYHPVHV